MSITSSELNRLVLPNISNPVYSENLNTLTTKDLELWIEKVCQAEITKILWCITAYNESGQALLSSLAGIKQNLDYLVRTGKKSLAQQVTICLIFDGQAKMSESVFWLLENLNLCNLSEIDTEKGTNLFQARLTLKQVEQLIHLEMSKEAQENPWLNVYRTAQEDNPIPDGIDSLESVRVLVCIKDKNKGKLNSHWWFFQVFSSYLKPDYCIQMDIGCVPKARNVNDLWNFMENNPNVGAAAGMVLCPEPRRFGDLIGLWQGAYFQRESFLMKPKEIVAGYLTILPGQFSMMRWKALAESNPEPERYQDNHHSTPLTHYFQGLGKLDIFKSNMFLTEDRVLGFGIVTALEHSWRLAHLPSVAVITEPCESLSELLKQRRRWFNGSFACGLWVSVQTIKYLMNPIAKNGTKIRLLRNLPTAFLTLLNDWFSPTILFISYYKLAEYIAYLLAKTNSVSWSILTTMSIACSLIIVYVINCLFNKFSQWLWFANVIYYALLLLILIAVELGTGRYLFTLTTGLIALVVWLISRLYSSWLSKQTRNLFPIYLLIELPITCLIKIYSFLNINDVSWGTKGLKQKKRNPLFKKAYVSLWLLSNALLLILALKFNFSLQILLLGLLDYGMALVLGLGAALSYSVKKIFITSAIK